MALRRPRYGLLGAGSATARQRTRGRSPRAASAWIPARRRPLCGESCHAPGTTVLRAPAGRAWVRAGNSDAYGRRGRYRHDHVPKHSGRPRASVAPRRRHLRPGVLAQLQLIAFFAPHPLCPVLASPAGIADERAHRPGRPSSRPGSALVTQASPPWPAEFAFSLVLLWPTHRLVGEPHPSLSSSRSAPWPATDRCAPGVAATAPAPVGAAPRPRHARPICRRRAISPGGGALFRPPSAFVRIVFTPWSCLRPPGSSCWLASHPAAFLR